MANPVESQYGNAAQNLSPLHHGHQLAATGLDVLPLIGLGVLLIVIGCAFLLVFFRNVNS